VVSYLFVAVGGAIGSVARYWAGGLAARWLGVSFPWGTVLINVLGSFVIGAFLAAGRHDARFGSPQAQALVMVGLCGGFTTFSAFSLQTVELMREGRAAAALANVALSVVLCLLATGAGLALFGSGRSA